MRGLAAVIVVSAILSPSLLKAQERDRSLERISIALQQPSPVVTGLAPAESDLPKKLGIFTLVAPTRRGEMVRVSLPIGEFVARAFDSIGAANQRRQEAAARRNVEAALKRFAEQQSAKR